MADHERHIPTGDLPPPPPSAAIRFATAQVVDFVFDRKRLAALLAWVELVVLDFLASYRDESGRNPNWKWTPGLTLADLSTRAEAIFGYDRPDLVRDAVEFAVAEEKVEEVRDRPEVGTIRYRITDPGYGWITKVRGDSNDEFANAREVFQHRFRRESGRELSHDAFLVFTALVNEVCRHAVEHGLVQWGGTRAYVRNGIDRFLAAGVVTTQGFFLGELGGVAEALLLDAFEPHNTILNAHVDKCLRIQRMLSELTDERLCQIGLVKEVARQLQGRTAVLDVDMVAEFFGLWACGQDFVYLWPMIGFERLGGQVVVLDEAWAELERVVEWKCREALRLARTARAGGKEVDDESKDANIFVRAFFDLQLHVSHRDPVELFRSCWTEFRDSLPVASDSAKRLARPDDIARARAALDQVRPPRSDEPKKSQKRDDDAELFAYVRAANGTIDPEATMADVFLVTRARRVDVAYRAAFGEEVRLVINPRNASTLVTALASATRSKLPPSAGLEYCKPLYDSATRAPFIPVVPPVADPTLNRFLFPDDTAPSRVTIQQEAFGQLAEFDAHTSAAREGARAEATTMPPDSGGGGEPADDEPRPADRVNHRRLAWALTAAGALGAIPAAVAWRGPLVVRLVVAVAVLTVGGCAALLARGKAMLAATVAGAVATVLVLVLTLPPPARATELKSKPTPALSVDRRAVRE